MINQLHSTPVVPASEPQVQRHSDFQGPSRRKVAAGLALSLLLHVLLLWFILHKRSEHIGEKPPAQTSVVVGLTYILPQPAAPSPAAKPVERKKKPAVAKHKPAPPRPPVVADATPPPQPPPPPAPEPDVAAPTDMMSMVNAARERRRKSEEAAGQVNAEAAARERGPSAMDIARENIQRSSSSRSRPGASGVFEVLYKGVRSAKFAFHGWNPGAGNRWNQTIDVDAPLGGDVELAIVRKMIALIREHYSGNFNWESHRLGRVVVQSARLEDNAELETFLMKEFFSNGYGAR